jgi:VWFA-related protein
MGPRRLSAGIVVLAAQALIAAAQGTGTAATPQDPLLRARPPAPQQSHAISEGKLHLDLVIGDASGKPVTDLEPWDLKLTDNGRPVKILSFRGYDGKTVMPDPPVEVVLILDELNLNMQQIAFVRDQVARFLRQNNGRTSLPTSIMVLTDLGLRVQPQPSRDGNGMAAVVDKMKPNINSINNATGAFGAFERVQISLREMQRIADHEAQLPGRKLLIWVGPGWPMLDSNRFRFTEQQQRWMFSSIVALENQLLVAHLVVNTIMPELSSMGVNESYIELYKSFLKPVEFAKQASPGNLALRVLATETGGRVLGPDNDLVAQINACLADSNAFYRISFDPPPAARTDEYHAINLVVDHPNLTIRTNTGYYDEPDQKP